MSLSPIDLQSIRSIVREEIQTEVEPLKRGQKRLEKQILELKKAVNMVIDVFDRQFIALNKRVTRIENHLQI